MWRGRALPGTDPSQQWSQFLIPLESRVGKRQPIPALAHALKTLIEDADLRERLGERASALATRHTWVKRAESLVQAVRAAGIGQDGAEVL